MRDSIKTQAVASEFGGVDREDPKLFGWINSRTSALTGLSLSTWLESGRFYLWTTPILGRTGDSERTGNNVQPIWWASWWPRAGRRHAKSGFTRQGRGHSSHGASLSTEKNQESGSESSNDLSSLQRLARWRGYLYPPKIHWKIMWGATTPRVRSTEAQESEQPERCPDALSEESPW